MDNTSLNGKSRSGPRERIEEFDQGQLPMSVPDSPANDDYPLPQAIAQRPLIFPVDAPAADLYSALALRLREAGDLFRLPAYASGLLMASPCPNIPPTEITSGRQMISVITDRVPVVVIRAGKSKGNRIPLEILNCMVHSELFLRHFQPVDLVVRHPIYVGNFDLTRPGYNDYGRGHRVFCVGDNSHFVRSAETINRFLDVMAFATPADRTNAVAAALTVMLRHYWPGEKPIVVVTSTKSHGGKDTIVQFASGSTSKTSISYERADWAIQKAFAASVKYDLEIGVINVENARTEGGGEIASAFLERLVTDPEPSLYSPGIGDPICRANHWVVMMTTNYGSVSEDILNRALPIHLCPRGDLAARHSAIGNPKLEYLPANREAIGAELRGLIVNWKAAGMPRDMTARHSFSDWARVVGGILKVNGYTDFLANCGARRTADDPLRKSLGILGAFSPDEWMRASEWAPLIAHLGLTDAVLAKADRESAESRRRGIGVVLSAHAAETFVAETDDESLTLVLEKARRRFGAAEPETRYRFVVVSRRPIPVDDSMS